MAIPVIVTWYMIVCSASWGDTGLVIPLWIVAVGASIKEDWDAELGEEELADPTPQFQAKLYVMPPGGSQCWWVKGVHGVSTEGSEVSKQRVRGGLLL